MVESDETKVLKETSLVNRFQEKDIRAKTATDADDDRQNATEILGHEDSRTTRIYIRSKQIKRVSHLIINSGNTDTPENSKGENQSLY